MSCWVTLRTCPDAARAAGDGSPYACGLRFRLPLRPDDNGTKRPPFACDRCGLWARAIRIEAGFARDLVAVVRAVRPQDVVTVIPEHALTALRSGLVTEAKL